MTLKRPLWMQPSGGDPSIQFSALDARALHFAIWRSEGIIRHGAAGPATLKVTQRAAGANFSVDVDVGQAAIQGDDVSSQGLYLVESDAVTNVVIPSPPGSGTRNHRVVARVKDKTHSGSYSTYEWTLEVLEDTGSGTPAVPASAISLARVAVSAGQASVLNSHITDDRVNALTLIGRPAFGSADADRPANPVDREMLWRTDHNYLEIYNSGAWNPLDPTPPYAMLRHSADQTVADSTNVAILFNTELADSHAGHSTSSNTSRYTAPRAGVYEFKAAVPWTNHAGSGKLEAFLRVNGGSTFNGSSIDKSTLNQTFINGFARDLRLNAGDYVELVVFQTTGASRTTTSGYRDGCALDISWDRPL